MNNKNTTNFLTNENEKGEKWGILNTENPTAFARELIKNGVDVTLIKEHLMKNYSVSEKMANLVYQTIKSQKTIIRNEKLINLQINMQFCDCDQGFNCQNNKTYDISAYLNALKTEINAVKEIVYEKSYVVRSIYIKGDMPNMLSLDEIDELLSEISYPVSEFTVECSTITEDKLDLLKKHRVSRLCIKPNSFVIKTLKTIGAKHTNNQIFETYMLALQNDFVVGMKFVAGLQGETFSNFKKTISTLLELSPHNVMIDAVKLEFEENQGQNEEIFEKEKLVKKMTDFSSQTLLKAGYKPYYLRLKNNFENIGFALEGKVSLFDIDVEEETLSLIGCGVGAVSKTVGVYNKKTQITQNDKNVEKYIEYINKSIKIKKKMF